MGGNSFWKGGGVGVGRKGIALFEASQTSFLRYGRHTNENIDNGEKYGFSTGREIWRSCVDNQLIFLNYPL